MCRQIIVWSRQPRSMLAPARSTSTAPATDDQQPVRPRRRAEAAAIIALRAGGKRRHFRIAFDGDGVAVVERRQRRLASSMPVATSNRTHGGGSSRPTERAITASAGGRWEIVRNRL